MLSYDQRTHDDIRLRVAIDRLLNIDRELDRERESARDAALQTTEKFRLYNKMYYDTKHKTPTKYKIGDYVLVRDFLACEPSPALAIS